MTWPNPIWSNLSVLTSSRASVPIPYMQCGDERGNLPYGD